MLPAERNKYPALNREEEGICGTRELVNKGPDVDFGLEENFSKHLFIERLLSSELDHLLHLIFIDLIDESHVDHCGQEGLPGDGPILVAESLEQIVHELLLLLLELFLEGFILRHFELYKRSKSSMGE